MDNNGQHMLANNYERAFRIQNHAALHYSLHCAHTNNMAGNALNTADLSADPQPKRK